MFVPGTHSLWQDITPMGVPMGGGLRLPASSGPLQKYLKELHQFPGMVSPGSNSGPRTTPCVVLKSASSPPLVPSPSPLLHAESPSPSPSPSKTTTTKLKFGVERLLAVDNEDSHLSQSSCEMAGGLLSSTSTASLNTPFSMTSPSLLPIGLQHHTSSLLAPVGLHSTSLTSRDASPPCGCEANNCGSDNSYIFSPLFAHTSSPFLPFGTVFNPNGPLGTSNSTVLNASVSNLALNRSLVSSAASIHSGMGSTPTKEGGSRRKRSWTRAVFSNLQRKGLEKRFLLQKYITKPDRRQLAATLGLTDAQVKVWFQNRRMKWRHAELRKIKTKDDEQKRQMTKPKKSPQQQQQQVSSTEAYFCDSNQQQQQKQQQSSYTSDSSEGEETDTETVAVSESSAIYEGKEENSNFIN